MKEHKLDLLQVTWVCLEWPRKGLHGGGVGRYVYRLSQAMRNLVALTVVGYEGSEPLDGVRLVSLPAPRTRLDRYYLAAWRARSAVEATVPDLIHAHGDDWLLSGRRPVVRSFYGTSWSEAKTSRGLRRANHLVLAGTECLSAHRAEMKLGIAHESVSAFGCDLAIPPYVPRTVTPPRAPSEVPTVMFVGSHEGRKRGWLAAKAVDEAAKTLGRSVRLVVVGPASDQGNWGGSVLHLAGLSDAEISEQFARAWCLVSPSSYEGFGIPLVEALEHELPVVASRNPGSSSVLAQGGASLPLVVTEDRLLGRALADRIARGPTLSSAEKADAAALVDSMASESSAERLVEVYRECMARWKVSQQS